MKYNDYPERMAAMAKKSECLSTEVIREFMDDFCADHGYPKLRDRDIVDMALWYMSSVFGKREDFKMPFPIEAP